jgi:hypothetical protein
MPLSRSALGTWAVRVAAVTALGAGTVTQLSTTPVALVADAPSSAATPVGPSVPASALVTAPPRERSAPRPTAPAAVPPAAVPPRAPAAAPPAGARPAAASPCSGDGWQQRRGRAALASLRAAAERTGFTVEFKGARSGYMGLTHLHERRIEMFVRPCSTQSDELLRHVMAHELGHAYDTTHQDEATRRAWQLARGIPLTTPWYGCSGCSDFATPAGDFAEVYAQWARGATANRSQLAGDVPAAQLTALAQRFFGA